MINLNLMTIILNIQINNHNTKKVNKVDLIKCLLKKI